VKPRLATTSRSPNATHANAFLWSGEVDDPEDEATRREQHVAEDQRGADPAPWLVSLGDPAALQPDPQQTEPTPAR
jgi:hypothetical protein